MGWSLTYPFFFLFNHCLVNRREGKGRKVRLRLSELRWASGRGAGGNSLTFPSSSSTPFHRLVNEEGSEGQGVEVVEGNRW